MSNTTHNIGTDDLANAAAEMLKELPLETGDNNFDLSIRVRGTIRKGEDYTQSIWTAARPEDVLALLYAYSGAVRETVKSMVEDENIRSLLAEVKKNPKRAAQLDDLFVILREQGTRDCKGKRTVVGVSVTPI